MKRGAIFFADLSPVRGSEQGGIRPVLIIQMIWGIAIAKRLLLRLLRPRELKNICQHTFT